MLSGADRAVLDESFRNAQMGREAINAVIGKVEDDDLALDLNRQACKFVQLEEKLQKMTDEFIKKVDQRVEVKTKEVMAI